MKTTAITLFCLLALMRHAETALPATITRSLSNLPASAPATLIFPPDHGARIESKYDGFNRETVVTLKRMRVTCGGAKGLQSTLNQTCVSFVASLHCPGVQLDYVRYAKLQLIFETKDWDRRHPLNERELFVVADGETLRLGRMALASQDVGTNQLVEVMKEVLEVSLPYQTFSKIARAAEVEMRVGKTTFALQKKNIDALRDLNNRVNFNQR
jgi:hypothetical protein